MPAWSTEIANDFIRLAAEQGHQLDQLQLQGLVYIAHGWCLASFGEPLTGDRPEAWEYGPMYRRLADALVQYGRHPVSREILASEAFPDIQMGKPDGPARSDLSRSENELVAEIFRNYGAFEAWQLSGVTRDGETSWRTVYAGGAGLHREISHSMIKAQFEGYGGWES